MEAHVGEVGSRKGTNAGEPEREAKVEDDKIAADEKMRQVRNRDECEDYAREHKI